MALGADGVGIAVLVFKEAAGLLGIGVIIGTALTLALGRTASALLFNVKPYDPPALATGIAALGGVALLASYLPARGVAKLNPMVALRNE
jgi:ABC-type antimicrobial peptide transport system permease subunit